MNLAVQSRRWLLLVSFHTPEWLRISGGDPDLLLQAITFSETRTYVRRIYEQYATYAAIYGVR